MITILGGDLLCALGDKKSRSQHLKNGTYKTKLKSMDVFGEERQFPFYALETKTSLPYLYDPIPLLIPLIQNLIEQLKLTEQDLSRCGLFLGCSANDLSISHPLASYEIQEHRHLKVENERVGNGCYADRLIQHFSLNCFSLTYNTACTSSANAIIDAATLLESGTIEHALVIGIEMFAQQSFEGFCSMQLLAHDKVKPFDQNRQGLAIGESLAALFLSKKTNIDSPWRFKAGISLNETTSVTGSKEDGSGIYDVMKKALLESKLAVENICVVKAHGTGSTMGDFAEINGMKKLFPTMPPFFSFKPYIGHTLGACGVSELILLMESVDSGFVPCTPNFDKVDADLNWSPIVTSKECSQGSFLLNYFGFGGNNTSLIIEKHTT